MQIHRLFEIVYLLMERGSVTAATLAEHFEVSTRTIYRDIDTLSGAGIPIYASKGRGGGIQLLPNFVLNKSLLSESEQNEILFALQSLQATNAVQSQQTLTRLSGLFRRSSVDWIDVDFSRWGGGEWERQKFVSLKTAILESRVIEFVYYNGAGEKSRRKAEPVKLRFKNDSWYLQAYCLSRQAFRTFKISRMQDVCVLDQRIEPRNVPVPELEMQETAYGSLVQVELVFSPKVAFRLFDEFAPDQIQKREDGSFYVAVQYPKSDWLCSYLLSFGAHVKVISPSYLQGLLQEQAKRIIGQYEAEQKF